MSGVVRRTYRCELLTPMIMSGADQSVAELRAPSIKGALRWWWRALNPTPPGADGKYHDLRAKEYAIFGGVHGEVAQKSKVSLHVAWETPELQREAIVCREGDGITQWTGPDNNRRPNAQDPVTYLLFGAYQMGTNTARTLVLPENVTGGRVTFVVSVKCGAAVWGEVEPAIQAMLTFGGFGLKHRNGFGQVSYTVKDHADSNNKFIDEKIEPKNFIEQRLEPVSEVGYASVTELSAISSIYAVKKDNWIHLIEDAGRMYMNAKKSINILTGESNNHLPPRIQTGEKNLFAAHRPEMFTHTDLSNDGGIGRIDKSIQIFAVKTPSGLGYGVLSLPYEVKVNGSSMQASTISALNGWKPGAIGGYNFNLRRPEKSRIEIIDQFFNNLKNPLK